MDSDLLLGLRYKLRFIERFYETASQPFREIKRKISEHEEPFVAPATHPDDWGGDPPFLEDWLEANESINLVGQASLTLVQSSLKEYLEGFIRSHFRQLPPKTGNWFKTYKRFFAERFEIEGDSGPVSLSELEEINLARNDIQHSGDRFELKRRQSPEHCDRFPSGLFVNQIYKQFGGGKIPGLIEVTSENLAVAIKRVEAFCEFLDTSRQRVYSMLHNSEAPQA